MGIHGPILIIASLLMTYRFYVQVCYIENMTTIYIRAVYVSWTENQDPSWNCLGFFNLNLGLVRTLS